LKDIKEGKMKKYVCGICGYVYDPAKGDSDGGIPQGTPFEKLPEDWSCPVCGAAKSEFSPE
jgi:rubredoxin